MSLTPDYFSDLLSARLDGQYRLRWSPSTEHWLVERKVRRALFDSPAQTDGQIRLRDGYELVLKFAPRPYVICDQCFMRTDLPAMEIAEVWCDHCQRLGNDRKIWFDGWFPLSERTINYLEEGSPKRAVERARELDEANRQRRKAEQRYRANLIEAIGKEYWNRVSGALQFGYTKAGTPHAYGSD